LRDYILTVVRRSTSCNCLTWSEKLGSTIMGTLLDALLQTMNECRRLWRQVEPSPPPTALLTRTEYPILVRSSAKAWTSMGALPCSSELALTNLASYNWERTCVSDGKKLLRTLSATSETCILNHLWDLAVVGFKKQAELLNHGLIVNVLRWSHSGFP